MSQVEGTHFMPPLPSSSQPAHPLPTTLPGAPPLPGAQDPPVLGASAAPLPSTEPPPPLPGRPLNDPDSNTAPPSSIPPLSTSEAGQEAASASDPQRSQGQTPAGPSGSVVPSDDALKEFYQEVRAVDRDNEVNRILGAFKLNPFEQLGLPFTALPEEIRKQYRKVSLLVHPDKCSHPHAKDAFEVLGHAYKELTDEERHAEVVHVLNLARDEIRKERKKAVKHDAAHRLASMLHEKGSAGVEGEYENTEPFNEAWKMKARDMLARAEWRRRKLTKRLQEEEGRIEADENETRERLKRDREHHKNWEQERETRVGSWRDFSSKANKKKKGAKALGGIKPPKLKEEDEERTYIQRPVGEQFRPPPIVAPKPHRG